MRFKKKESCICTNVGDQAIILNIENGHYYELNKTGLAIWDTLEKHSNAESIADALSPMFNVESKIIKNDINNFLNECLNHGFLGTE
tara:strand:+ start:295 stop:555 length:261 start_codon:yes stop_codon:yes gene_type:complete